MCGIVGYIGEDYSGSKKIYQGLKSLEYRGYDSCGIAISNDKNNKIEVFKSLGDANNLLKFKIPTSKMGIGHTRWATHGSVSINNAHPHSSYDSAVHLVHNGVIENSDKIKNYLKSKNIIFYGDTDSEVLVNLISYNYKKCKPCTHIEVIKKSLREVEGTYGLAIIFKDNKDVIYGAKRSSPLIVGVGKDENFLASDKNALPPHVSKVVYLDDEQIVSISNKDFKVFYLNSNTSLNGYSLLKEVENDYHKVDKGVFSSFMEKEIFEQSKSIEDTSAGRLTDEEIKLGGINLNKKINRFLFLGCGTAYNAGLAGKYFMENIARIPACVEYSSEYKYKTNPFDKNLFAVAISQSGETIDTMGAIKEAQSKNVNTMAITNAVMSSLARLVPEGIYQRVGPEISVASTKSFTSQLTLLLMLSIAVGRKRNMSTLQCRKYISEIKNIPNLINAALQLKPKIQRLAGIFYQFDSIDFLGRQYMYPLAMESSLKLKELAYINSHAYAAGELKHGPLATVYEGKPFFFLAPQESLKEKNISNMKEIKARGGSIILLKQKGQNFPKDCFDEIIEVPKADSYILPIISAIPLQMFAMYMAQKRGLDVDKPRNLAKSVTVE
jgi:glucosamine--fructose-6-phosphate aminotransferase (isomerizing)